MDDVSLTHFEWRNILFRLCYLIFQWPHITIFGNVFVLLTFFVVLHLREKFDLNVCKCMYMDLIRACFFSQKLDSYTENNDIKSNIYCSLPECPTRYVRWLTAVTWNNRCHWFIYMVYQNTIFDNHKQFS